MTKLTDQKVFTIVRLAYDATVEKACELASIPRSDVNLVQRIGERSPADVKDEFRIISFDGTQITISERINGERRVRGFRVS